MPGKPDRAVFLDATKQMSTQLKRCIVGEDGVAGVAAGGGLTTALMVWLRNEDIPLPATITYLSPWVDLELTGVSLTTCAQVDPIYSLEESRFHAV